MALRRKWIPSPCYSSRGGSSVRLIVLHTAEGARTIEDLGHFFQNSANQVSSHTGADDQAGVIGEYVTRGNKAWTAASFNPVAVQLELCGFASWSRSTWLNSHRTMLENAAKWIAEEADRYGIPIDDLSPSQAQGGGRGVCQHIDLGSGGGGHVDCGSGFPMDDVLKWARDGVKPPKPQPAYYYYGTEAMQLAFSTATPDRAACCTLAVPTQHADGKSRLVLACAEDSSIRIDFGGAAPTAKVKIGYDEGRQGAEIPQNCKAITVRRDSGSEPVSADYSRTREDM